MVYSRDVILAALRAFHAARETILKFLMKFTSYHRNRFLLTTPEEPHQSTAASTWWCGVRPRLGWVEMAVGLPEGPDNPGHSPLFFRYADP